MRRQGALVLFGHSAKKHFLDLCESAPGTVLYMDTRLSGASRALYRQVFRRLEQLGCAIFRLLPTQQHSKGGMPLHLWAWYSD